MNVNYITKKLTNELFNPKQREKRKKRRLERKQHKKRMLRLFGRARYCLSVLFGQWVLVTWNKRDYQEVEKERYYKDKVVAEKYAGKYRQLYDTVTIETVYNRQKIDIGYLVVCKGKKAAYTQPSNVINLNQYINNKKLSKALH